MIAVIAALRTEVRGIRHGRLHIEISGIGAERARGAAERLCDEASPELLVSAGFCGALDRSLKTGDLIAGGARREGKTFPFDAHAVEAVPQARRGDALWVPAVQRELSAPSEGVLCVDMESAAVADVAERRAIPFLMLRAVLDTPEAPLASTYSWVLLFQPWKWPAVRHDARRARIAADALSDGLRMLSKNLPPAGK